MERSSPVSGGLSSVVFMERGIQSSHLPRTTLHKIYIASKSNFLVMWHLLWQKLLKTNKKGTIDKFINSRLVLDHICQTASTVGHTATFSSFLIPAPRPCTHSLCVYGYSSVITLEVQNTWRKGCDRVSLALTSLLSAFRFG